MESAPYEVLFARLIFRKNNAAKSRDRAADDNSGEPKYAVDHGFVDRPPSSAATAGKRRDAKSSPGGPATK
jgi:hypothetical protein